VNFSLIKTIVDSLLAVGQIVSVQEQIDAILEGLPSEYESLVTAISSKIDQFEFEEIQSLLLAQEQRLEKLRESVVTPALNLTPAQTKKAEDIDSNSAPRVQFTQHIDGGRSSNSRGRGDRSGYGYRGGKNYGNNDNINYGNNDNRNFGNGDHMNYGNTDRHKIQCQVLLQVWSQCVGARKRDR